MRELSSRESRAIREGNLRSVAPGRSTEENPIVTGTPGGMNDIPWINPIGGLGDMLMLSGVLKLVVDRDPTRRYNLIRRTNYLAFLKGHPAIANIGYPSRDAKIVGVDYWSMETLGRGNQRAFQVLARSFGLVTPVEEHLYVPGEIREDPILTNFIPWKKPTVIIAPASDSPRKMMHPSIWHRLVDLLLAEGFFVMQVGRSRDLHIRNAYSVLGLTTPHQAIGLVKECDLVITSDNFLMHAAHFVGKPAVAIWGATDHEVYGYPEQIHIQTPKGCDLGNDEDCIAPSRNDKGKLYGTPCPHKERHCMDQAKPEMVFEAARKLLFSGSCRQILQV